MEKPLPVQYDDMFLGLGLRLDILVEKQVVVETKTVRVFRPVHHAQLLTYLRLAPTTRRLLLNFNTAMLSDGGIKRIVNQYKPAP